MKDVFSRYGAGRCFEECDDDCGGSSAGRVEDKGNLSWTFLAIWLLATISVWVVGHFSSSNFGQTSVFFQIVAAVVYAIDSMCFVHAYHAYRKERKEGWWQKISKAICVICIVFGLAASVMHLVQAVMILVR